MKRRPIRQIRLDDQHPPDGYEAYLEWMIDDLCEARDEKDRVKQAMILARYYG